MKKYIIKRFFLITCIIMLLFNWMFKYIVLAESQTDTLEDISVEETCEYGKAYMTFNNEVELKSFEELRQALESKYKYKGTASQLAELCGVSVTDGVFEESSNTKGVKIEIDENTTIILGFDRKVISMSSSLEDYKIKIVISNIQIVKNTGEDNNDENNDKVSDSMSVSSNLNIPNYSTGVDTDSSSDDDTDSSSDDDADISDGGLEQIGFGGFVFEAIYNLVLAIFDSINATIQSLMYKGEDANGPLKNILNVIGNTFEIMSKETADAEFDSVGSTSTVTVHILQKYYPTRIPHIHYSCEEIFSGKVGILGIDFISGEGQTEGLASVRKVIASWYKTLRLIAIVGFLSILIYTGIRIMLSSTAEDKAKYKEWIINWIIGLGILFFMHYIMSFIITVVKQFNEGLSVSIQYIQADVSVDKTIGTIKDVFNTNLIGFVRYCAQSSVPKFKLGYVIIYVILTTYTLKFTFVYLKRVINMAFLTLIAPIVAFTYPLDKLSDGNAQGFSMWLKEYVFNALLQPMHFLLYYILVWSSIIIAAKNPIYALAVLAFMSEGERLLRKIFGFDKASGGTVKGMQDAFAAAAIATSLRGLMNRGGKSGGNSTQGKINLPGSAINTDYKNGITMNENVLIGGSADSGGGGSGGGGSGGGGSGEGGSGGGDSGGGSSGGGSSGGGGSGEGGSGGGSTGTGDNQIISDSTKTNNSQQQPLSIRQKAFRTARAIGKRTVRPIWDFDKKGKYNKKRLIRKIAKGVIGTGVGITAAAVQAGISLTDGKYNPAEGVAAFAGGFGLAGRKIDQAADLFEQGAKEGLTDEEKMAAYQEDFRNRDDVIQFCKDNYGDEWKEYADRMANNFVPRGFTDLKEIKEMMNYSKAISGDTSKLTSSQKRELFAKNDIAAMSIKNVQRRKQAEKSLGTVYDKDKENAYIAAKTQGMDANEAEKLAKQYRGEDAAIRYYNSIVKG